MSQSAFIPTQVVIQLDNSLQPPQWGAPLLLAGVTVILDGSGNTMYQPAYTNRPAAAADLTPEILEAVNRQLAIAGFKLEKLVVEA